MSMHYSLDFSVENNTPFGKDVFRKAEISKKLSKHPAAECETT